MAKMDVLKALAVLAESGIELSEEQSTALEEFKSKALRDAAVEILTRKVLIDEDDETTAEEAADQWVSDMFAFAERMGEEIVGSTVGRGRGEVFERVFKITTPAGSLKVSLTNGSDED